MRALLLLLIIATGASRCNGDDGPTAPGAISPVIVAFGDSLTSGPGLGRNEAYPALLQRRMTAEQREYRVVNAGVTGETTSEAVLRFDSTLVPGTKIVILAIGINDGLRGVPVSTVERNIAAMIERAQARGIQVLLCGMEAPPVGPGGLIYTVDFHRMYTRLADRYRVPLVPFFLTAIIGNDEWNLDDSLHPNAAGHRVIAEAIWPHLRPML